MGILVSWAGLGLSFIFDLPTGSTLVCAFGITFIAILGFSFLLKNEAYTPRRYAASLKVIVGWDKRGIIIESPKIA